MDVYLAIVCTTDYDDHGYAFDEVIGVFDDEKKADDAAKEAYLVSISPNAYDSDSVVGYRVDKFAMNSKEREVGVTKYKNYQGEWISQML